MDKLMNKAKDLLGKHTNDKNGSYTQGSVNPKAHHSSGGGLVGDFNKADDYDDTRASGGYGGSGGGLIGDSSQAYQYEGHSMRDSESRGGGLVGDSSQGDQYDRQSRGSGYGGGGLVGDASEAVTYGQQRMDGGRGGGLVGDSSQEGQYGQGSMMSGGQDRSEQGHGHLQSRQSAIASGTQGMQDDSVGMHGSGRALESSYQRGMERGDDRSNDM